MDSVVVMMSSYNGEKYIEEQVKSIFEQEQVDVTLYIRDDNSTDNTKAILNRLLIKYDQLVVSFGDDLGAAISFMQLIEETTIIASYYALADQDDIWEPRKLVTAINMLKTNSNFLLYASNQKLVNAENVFIKNRYSFNPPVDIFNIVDKNYLAGCTMVLKKELMVQIKDKKPSNNLVKERMHDTWIAAVAACLGDIIYDSSAYIRYRQHENNVVGTRTISLRKRIAAKIKCRNPYHKRFADELLRLYGDRMSRNSKNLLIYYYNCDSLIGKIRLLKSSSFRKNYFRSKIQFGFKLLMFE